MKKSIVALAALAATGAFAQVTITGEVALGFASGANSLGATSSGFGVDTAKIDFGVSEDLGGGFKSAASLGLDNLAHSNGGTTAGNIADNTSLSLTTPGAGTIVLTSTVLTDYLSNGTADAAQGLNDFGGYGNDVSPAFFSTNTTQASGVVYVLPVGPVTLKAASLSVSLGNLTSTSPALGTGYAGPAIAVAQNVSLFGAAYNKGALSAEVEYLGWNDQSNALGAKSTTRLAASYDFGVVKVAGGVQDWTTVGGTDNQSLLSVSLPLGATTLGAAWVEEQNNGGAFANLLSQNGTRTGYSLSASYALSKQTSVQAQYMSYQAMNGTLAGAANQGSSNSTSTEVALVKAF